jgi:hypothetical protein
MKRILCVLMVVFTALAVNAQVSAPWVNLGPDVVQCNPGAVTLNPLSTVVLHPDSLVITYNATLGQSNLQGAAKVYMHSGYELAPFGGPQGWVGNWGQDDGLGEMTQIGPNLWRITIHVTSYYGLAPGTNLNGLFMVFRNENGTAEGKDDNGNDIFLLLAAPSPSSAFSGVTAFIKRDNVQSILWSTGASTPTISVNSNGSYWVQVTDTNNVVYADTVNVTFSPTANLTLGPDQSFCSTTFSTVLNAGSGYDSYLWNNGATSASISVSQPGQYWVQVTASGCTGSDTVNVSILGVGQSFSLGNDTLVCGPGAVLLNTGLLVSPLQDSLTIIYDATQGVSGLVGATKVYMHAGAELVPFGGWQITVGNWGQDDGLGQMTNIGPNLWKITINPYSYFGLQQGQNLNGILMVFRNEIGTATGKDFNNNDIFLSMVSDPPSSGFSGITPTFVPSFFNSIVWSDGSTLPSLLVTQPGTYTATVTTTSGCVITDSINVTFGTIPFVDAGNSQDICNGSSITLTAPAGFASYSWNTGANTPSITVSSAGTYILTATNNEGCSGIDVININVIDVPVASFTFAMSPSNPFQFTFNSTSVDAYTHAWDFTGDGVTNSTASNTFFVYFNQGTFNVRLIVTNPCGADTIIVPIVVGSVRNNTVSKVLKFFPNPVNEQLNISVPAEWQNKQLFISITDISGRFIVNNQLLSPSGSELQTFVLPSIEAGNYFIRLSDGSDFYHAKFIKP